MHIVVKNGKRHTRNPRAALECLLAIVRQAVANRIEQQRKTHGIGKGFNQGISFAPNFLPERVGA
jgi:hypothetical protein